MKCPHCTNEHTQVKDSRSSEDNTAIRRRRECVKCGARFTTFERVQLRELTVIKNDGHKEPFDRDKLLFSVKIAMRKRPVDPDTVEEVVSDIVRKLERSLDGEVSSRKIGLEVMQALKELDGVGYVRFASVYKDFREAGDFRKVLDELGNISS
jgi:transcriptional repressor NrdR